MQTAENIKTQLKQNFLTTKYVHYVTIKLYLYCSYNN